MSINLIVDLETPPMGWRDFCKQVGGNAIALDGYCASPTKLNNSKKIFNINHHEGSFRFATLATCSQLNLAIDTGLFDFFRNDKGEIDVDVYVNDCDEDVCMSVFLLKYPHISESIDNSALNELLEAENLLDITAGAYPFNKNNPLLRKLAWIFYPYRSARNNGLLAKKDALLVENIITDVCHRIKAHIEGKGEEISVDTSYEIIHSGKGWSLVKESGPYSRTGIYSDGIKSFISLLNERNSGTYDYVIGKMSLFVDFDIERLFTILNEEEAKLQKNNEIVDFWGGSDTIGGSPRVSGSMINPKRMIEIVENFMK